MKLRFIILASIIAMNTLIDYDPIRISSLSASFPILRLPASTQSVAKAITPITAPSPTQGSQTRTLKVTPTKTPRPTLSPPDLPPANPNLARLMIGAGILVVVVVIFGVWVNRHQLR